MVYNYYTTNLTVIEKILTASEWNTNLLKVT